MQAVACITDAINLIVDLRDIGNEILTGQDDALTMLFSKLASWVAFAQDDSSHNEDRWQLSEHLDWIFSALIRQSFHRHINNVQLFAAGMQIFMIFSILASEYVNKFTKELAELLPLEDIINTLQAHKLQEKVIFDLFYSC